LTGLNQQNFPKGIPLTQVWELIQKGAKSSAAAAANDPGLLHKVRNSTPLPEGGTDLEKWRQLLTQAGMDPELVQTLTSGLSPTNRGELQATLAQMAPSSTPREQETPQPLYLPGSVRVRQVPLLQRMEPSLGKEGGNSNWGQNLGSLPQAQIADLGGAAHLNTGTTDLQNFLAYLNSNGAQSADLTGAQWATGSQAPAANSYLTPEAREALWSQVQSGVLGNLRPGENQVSLTLNPPDLGKLDLTLHLKGQIVEVTAITTHPAVAEAAAAGVQQLAQALNQQGLILTQFQFHHQDEAAHSQSQFAFSQNSGDQRQTGKKESDKWEQTPTPRRQRWTGGGIDCFA
jgi:flagellar hook-length control protein FliK